MLKLNNITYSYEGKNNIIENLSLEITNGEIIFLIGPNGVGKTTILKLIYGIMNPDHGDIEFKNKSILNLNPRERLNKGLAFLPQKDKIFPNLTVEENLIISGSILDRKVRKGRIEEIFRKFAILEDKIKQKARTLSGGEQQVLSLAMGLIHEPELFLLDEPSAGLDPKSTKKVFDIIKLLNEEEHLTFLIVEHKIQKLLSYPNRVIGLSQNKKKHEQIPKHIKDDFFKKVYLNKVT